MDFLNSDREMLLNRWKEAGNDIEQLRSLQEKLQVDYRLKSTSWRLDDCCSAIILGPAGTYQEAYDAAKGRIDHLGALQDSMCDKNSCTAPDKPSSGRSTAEPSPSESLAGDVAWVTEEEWAARTRGVLKESEKLRSDMDAKEKSAQRQFGLLVPPSQVKALPIRGTSQAMDRQKSRVATEKSIQEALKWRMKENEQAMFQVADVLKTLEKDKIWDVWTLGERKLELRAQRPPTELTQDPFQVALDREVSLLREAGRTLESLIKEGKDVANKLEESKDEMLKKKLVLHLDRSQYPQELLERAQSTINMSKQFCSRAESTLSQKKNAADQARSKALAEMKQHLENTVALRKQLETEIKDNKVHIADTQRCLAKLKFELEAYSQKQQQTEEDDAAKEEEEEAAKPAWRQKGSKVQYAAVLQSVRSKMKAAAYSGPGCRSIDDVLRKFDKDNSGALDRDEFRQAIRRAMKIPASILSDAEVLAVGNMLDGDHSGSIDIQEIKDFVDFLDPEALQDQINDIEQNLTELTACNEEMMSDWRNKVVAWKIDEKCRLLVNVATQASTFGNTGKGLSLTSPSSMRALESPRLVESPRTPMSPSSQPQSPRSLQPASPEVQSLVG